LNAYTVFVLVIVHIASDFVRRAAVLPPVIVVIVAVVIGMRVMMIVMDCLAKGMLFIWHGSSLNGSECQRVVKD